MKKLIFTVIVAAVIAIALPTVSMAATQTGSMPVIAGVVKACSIVTVNSGVDFGTYDPTSGADKTEATNGQFSFTCVKATAYTTYIAPAAAARIMVGAVNLDNLPYKLYSDAGRTTEWVSASGSEGGSSTGKNDTINRYVYGKIPFGADVSIDSYSQNVTVTVDY